MASPKIQFLRYVINEKKFPKRKEEYIEISDNRNKMRGQEQMVKNESEVERKERGCHIGHNKEQRTLRKVQRKTENTVQALMVG